MFLTLVWTSDFRFPFVIGAYDGKVLTIIAFHFCLLPIHFRLLPVVVLDCVGHCETLEGHVGGLATKQSRDNPG